MIVTKSISKAICFIVFFLHAALVKLHVDLLTVFSVKFYSVETIKIYPERMLYGYMISGINSYIITSNFLR